MDQHTMLHELAHAWANIHLTDDDRHQFVASRKLASWNDQDDEWSLRGTEHVAETIAWALGAEPKHVRWVEDGITTHRLLTLSIGVDTLLANFTELTDAEADLPPR